MVKGHSDSGRGNLLLPLHGLLFLISLLPTDMITHTTAFVRPVEKYHGATSRNISLNTTE